MFLKYQLICTLGSRKLKYMLSFIKCSRIVIIWLGFFLVRREIDDRGDGGRKKEEERLSKKPWQCK